MCPNLRLRSFIHPLFRSSLYHFSIYLRCVFLLFGFLCILAFAYIMHEFACNLILCIIYCFPILYIVCCMIEKYVRIHIIDIYCDKSFYTLLHYSIPRRLKCRLTFFSVYFVYIYSTPPS